VEGLESEKASAFPGFKTVEQVEENVAAMRFGPLDKQQMQAVDEILGCESL
jgi:aryl-alcohol dehydrogenase-like predicted oxidoreductase